MTPTKTTPARLATITPFLVVKDSQKAVEFYVNGLGAVEQTRYEEPDGKLTARLVIGEAEFWIGSEEPEFDNLSPQTIGGSPVRIVLTVDDPETIFSKALQAGARQICPVTTEESWKIGKLMDPFGHIWEIGHPLGED